MLAFNDEELLAWLDGLPVVRLGKKYTPTDRAGDFMRIFRTEEGQRVFAQIAQFCSPNPTPAHADQPGRLAFKEGQRYVMALIMAAMTVPAPQPEEEGATDVSDVS